MKNNSIDYLKELLTNSGFPDLLKDADYELLLDEYMVETHNQARAFAKIITDAVTLYYNAGYSTGISNQAFKDGKNAEKLEMKINKLKQQIGVNDED